MFRSIKTNLFQRDAKHMRFTLRIQILTRQFPSGNFILRVKSHSNSIVALVFELEFYSKKFRKHDDNDDGRFVKLVAASQPSESVHDENRARDDHPRFNDNVGYDVEMSQAVIRRSRAALFMVYASVTRCRVYPRRDRYRDRDY